MKALLIFLTAATLAACAGAPVAGDPEPLFADALFAPPAEPVGVDQLFTLSDEMREFVASRVKPLGDKSNGLHLRLFEALRSELKIDYESARTRVAADTFAARSGNCLSLVILTAAFAKELDVPIYYRSVYGHDTWSRSGGIAFQSGHVNVQFSARYAEGLNRTGDKPLVIDFLAPESAAMLYSRPESEETILAMYLNNRAAERVVDGDPDAAYWWARAAVKREPSFLSAYNTLGVIYLRHGNLPEAERSLRYLLQREPDNANALSNLVRVLQQDGRLAEADATRHRLADLAPYPPFYFLDQGLNALLKGDNEIALDLLKKELRRMPYDDEVHFAIAMADLRLGDLRRAREHLGIALENSTTPDRRNIYAAKLNYLRHLPAND